MLTHLLGQLLEALDGKIKSYRNAWRAAGQAGQGQVTLMLHSFVGEDDDSVRRTVEALMLRYLGSSANLVGNYIASVPFFSNAARPPRGRCRPTMCATRSSSPSSATTPPVR